MRMWEGGGRPVNRLGPSDQHVPGSVELMTLKGPTPFRPGPVGPGYVGYAARCGRLQSCWWESRGAVLPG